MSPLKFGTIPLMRLIIRVRRDPGVLDAGEVGRKEVHVDEGRAGRLAMRRPSPVAYFDVMRSALASDGL